MKVPKERIWAENGRKNWHESIWKTYPIIAKCNLQQILRSIMPLCNRDHNNSLLILTLKREVIKQCSVFIREKDGREADEYTGEEPLAK